MNKLDRFLSQLHSGQWFTYSDPKDKSFDILELTEYGKEQGYELPTKQDFDQWKQQQKEQQKIQEVLNKRKAEYGSADEQMENIIENGIEAERQRIKEIKKKYPKPN